MLKMPPKIHGIMPIQELRKAAAGSMIASPHSPIPRENIQPASLDLRLGNVAHRLRCSFLPHNGRVEDRLEDLAMESLPLDGNGGAVLEINRPYLVPLLEELNLPPEIRARANPRSSTGRMDLFTRVITDGSAQFDNIAPGYRGRMYLEIISRSFACRIRTGISLNQIRFLRGDPRISGDDLLEEHLREPLALLEGEPCRFNPGDLDGGVPLSVDLAGGENGNGTVGYRARRNSGLLDLTRLDANQAGDFWEPVRAEPGRKLVLEPEELYLLASREAMQIPPDLAAEMVALDPRSGEFRTHYAGFFDPGFGYGGEATRAVMEIRAHDAPFMLEHGQPVCRLEFEGMLAAPEVLYGAAGAGSSYQGQGLRLSKYFRRQTP